MRSEISNSLQAYLWYDHRFLNFGEREPWYPKEIPERIVTSCRHSTKVCGPTVSTSYSTDQIGTCLIRVATAYSNYCCCFKFQNWISLLHHIDHVNFGDYWIQNGDCILNTKSNPLQTCESHRQLSCTFENLSYNTEKYVNLPQW